MSTGVPAFTRSTFSYDKSPTLFHPASSKMEPAKPPVVDSDNSSIATTSTFSSKVELLKESVKSKIPATYRDFRSRKESAAGSVVASKGEKRLPPDTKTRKLFRIVNAGVKLAVVSFNVERLND